MVSIRSIIALNLRKTNKTFMDSFSREANIYWCPSLIRGKRCFISEIGIDGSLASESGKITVFVCDKENRYERVYWITTELFNSLGFAELRALMGQLFTLTV